jgi:hypothetical protein
MQMVSEPISTGRPFENEGQPQLLVANQKEIKMLSKSSLRIIVVVLVLGAAFVTLASIHRESGEHSASVNPAESLRQYEQRYANAPQSSAPVISAETLRKLDMISRHADALQQAPQQDTLAETVAAERRWTLNEQHSEALQQNEMIDRSFHKPQTSSYSLPKYLPSENELPADIVDTAKRVTDPAVLKELAEVRQATAKYQAVNVALADGFVRTPTCVSDPDLGGMGIHFINPPRLMDPAVNILEPEILLYVAKDAGMKLLGVEYMFGVGAPDAAVPNPAPPSPIIFNRVLDGPMLGHEPGQPPHYDLHVWIWQANPSGIFAQYNPNVKCP